MCCCSASLRRVISVASPPTGPHPELTVAAAVLVLLVIVIISLIVLVVIWKQVLPASFGIHSLNHSWILTPFFPDYLIMLIYFERLRLG